MGAVFKILAIDGGGIRGIFAAQILKRIKDELKIEFHKEFNLIAGTSTGSIVAGGLAIDYPIESIVSLYKNEGEKIFQRNYSDRLNWWNWKSGWRNWRKKWENKWRNAAC